MPLFIIGRNNLVNLLNEALDEYCYEMEIEHDAFSANEIIAALREHKICVSRMPSDHRCFSFQYPVRKTYCEYEKKEVYILRLNKDYYRKLCENRKIYEKEKAEQVWLKTEGRKFCSQEYKEIARDLQTVFKSIRWQYGKLDL